MDHMDYFERLKFYGYFTVEQAALYISGASSKEALDYVGYRPEETDEMLKPLLDALCDDIESSKLPAKKEFSEKFEYSEGREVTVLDVYSTKIAYEDLIVWMHDRNKTLGTLSQIESNQLGYLNREHERYAPKLHAAVDAWLEFEGIKVPKGKSVKGDLKDWLYKHAKDYKLIKSDGKFNEEGIEDCAKVANWDPRRVI